MKASMLTYASARRARDYLLPGNRSARKQKRQLRRLARHRDKNAQRIGNFEVIHRGQSNYDVC